MWWVWSTCIHCFCCSLRTSPFFVAIFLGLVLQNINTALLCYMAHEFVYKSWQFSEASAKGDIVDGYKVTAAGVVSTLVLTFVWIIINASDDERLQASVAPAK